MKLRRPTPHVMRIAQLRVQGKSYKEIGKLLKISPKTAATHMERLYFKLDVHNIAQLIAKLGSYNERDFDALWG